jgi:hypothetical protein
MIRNGSYPSKKVSIMIDNDNAIDRIEWAERETPNCGDCGEPMVPVARPDGIWLECSSLSATDAGRISRLLSALTASAHSRRLVVEQADAA